MTPPVPTDGLTAPTQGPDAATSVSGDPLVGRFATAQRLHPASIVLGVPLASLLQVAVVPLFAGAATGGFVTLGIYAAIGIIALPLRILAWQRKRFSFDGEVLRVDSGVLSRSHRSLDVARIQQVEIQRGPVQRLLGLAAIRVETAGSASEPEVDLRVLPEADAEALRAAVRASKARKEGRPVGRAAAGGAPTGAAGADGAADGELGDDAWDLHDDPGREIIAVPTKHIALGAITGAQLLVLPAVIGAAFQFIGQQIGSFVDDAVETALELGLEPPEGGGFTGFDWRFIALVVVMVFVLTLVTAAVVGIVRDGNFRIVLRDDDLHVTRGLLTKRESVVPLRRVQLVEVQRNWIRRLLGYSSVRVRSAGGSTGGDGRVTVPLLRDEDVDALVLAFLPGTPGIPELTAHPPAALRRALFRWLRPTGMAIAIVWVATEFVPFLDGPVTDRGRLLALGLLPIAAVLAFVEYRQLAHGLTDRVVAARQGALSVTTTLAPVVKVQAVTSRSNPFQRRLGLSTLVAHVAGPGAIVEVLDAAEDDVERLLGELNQHAASPIPRPLDDPAADLPEPLPAT